MRQSLPSWHLRQAIPNKSFYPNTVSYRAFSSHQYKHERASTLRAVAPVTNSTTIGRPGRFQKTTPNREDFAKQNDPFHLFQAFADSQKNYERYGGHGLFKSTYKQAAQRLNAISAEINRVDKKLIVHFMSQNPDPALFRKFKEIAHLRRNYVRTIGNQGFEERTDQSAARLRAEGLLVGLPRLLRNARGQSGSLKQARKQNPYRSRSDRLMREETRQAMLNASFSLKMRFSSSPKARCKEQLRVLNRWLKLSELDRLSPRPFLKPSEREELKDALAETHQLGLYLNRVFQFCKAICVIFVCAFVMWRAGSDLIKRRRHSKEQATLE